MYPEKILRNFRRMGWLSLARSPHEKRYHPGLIMPAWKGQHPRKYG
jgi:hypothetical protein